MTAWIALAIVALTAEPAWEIHDVWLDWGESYDVEIFAVQHCPPIVFVDGQLMKPQREKHGDPDVWLVYLFPDNTAPRELRILIREGFQSVDIAKVNRVRLL